MRDADSGRGVCDGDGGVQRGCQREKYWPPTDVVGNCSKGRCGKVYREARVQAGMIQGRNRKWEVSGLKTGQRRDVRKRTFSNVTTLRPTSRRSREDIFQCCKVETNVATFQRGKCSNVATFDLTSRRSREC